MPDPGFGADRQGIWLEQFPGQRMTFPWAEIVAVHTFPLELPEQRIRVVAFEHESGHSLEFQTCWPGFEEFAAAVREWHELPSFTNL